MEDQVNSSLRIAGIPEKGRNLPLGRRGNSAVVMP
jgi:hypothetical protein